MRIDLPAKFKDIFKPYRYKIFYGGRGGTKTTGFTIALLLISLHEKCTILCCREYQTSIKNSVHKVLCNEIDRLGLSAHFNITHDKITSIVGSEFIFAGLHNNIENIKSIPNIKYCFVEEAQTVSDASWDVLIPTIRADDSEIWAGFNPYLETDPVYQRFVLNTPPNTLLVKIGWQDNPFFPKVLYDEMMYLKEVDYIRYLNVWEGECLTTSDAIIFKDKFEVRDFDSPEKADWLHGLDWGFSNDPAAAVRCYTNDGYLYIDYEMYGYGIEIDEYAQHLRQIPTLTKGGWKIMADCSLPGNISLLKRQGFNVEGAKKYPGSVEDGITHLRNYRKIVVHPRCVNMIKELKSYSWKTDKVTGEIQPVPIDKDNHLIDSLRYALGKYIIQENLNLLQWKKFAERS